MSSKGKPVILVREMTSANDI